MRRNTNTPNWRLIAVLAVVLVVGAVLGVAALSTLSGSNQRPLGSTPSGLADPGVKSQPTTVTPIGPDSLLHSSSQDGTLLASIDPVVPVPQQPDVRRDSSAPMHTPIGS